LNFEIFIGRRISTSKYSNSLSHIFIRIAVIASALSLVVMILSVSILDGFKSAIRNKLAGFGSHIVVNKHDSNNSFETNPIKYDENIILSIKNIDGVKHIQTYALKAGLVKTNSETQGVILKGVSEDFDWSFFDEIMVKGKHFDVEKSDITGKNVVISEALAKIADLDTGQYLYMYFIDNQTRMRKYKISGIYNSGMSDFDKLYVIADIYDVAKLNNWNTEDYNEISGYEILIKDFSDIDDVTEEVNRQIGFRFDINGDKLNVSSLEQLYPQIFDWLSLLDMNAIVLLVIMLVIASINMVTALLILILERTRMIGILKAVGAENFSIRKIFIYNGLSILIKGLLWGNLIGLGFVFLQYFTHFMPLDPELYYVDYVPLEINFLKFTIINIGVIILTFVVLVLPSFLITKIDPVKAIRFD